jgi:hypothetical protein
MPHFIIDVQRRNGEEIVAETINCFVYDENELRELMETYLLDDVDGRMTTDPYNGDIDESQMQHPVHVIRAYTEIKRKKTDETELVRRIFDELQLSSKSG